MILAGIISENEAIRKSVPHLLMYNKEYGIGFICSSLVSYQSIPAETRFVDVTMVDAINNETTAVETIRYIVKNNSTLRVVVIMENNNAGIMLTMIKAGAVGFLINPFSQKTLEACLANVFNNKTYLDEGTLFRIFSILQTGEDQSSKEPLSKRELEIIKLITRGHTNKEIGGLLYISHHTVNEHLKKIYRKFDVNSRGKLINRLVGMNNGK